MDVENTGASRRDVIRAAAAFAIVPAAAVKGSQANSLLTVGMIGTGNRGSYDGSIVEADPRARVTAVCDLFDDKLERGVAKMKAQNPAVYKDFEKLLASDVDAVVIATPVFEHPRMLEAAVQAKKHVYCEKPAAVDTAGCLRVMKAGRMAGREINISFGFQQRYGPVYLEGYRRLREGELGDLIAARAFWIGGSVVTAARKRLAPASWEEKIRNWYAYPELCGDSIVEQQCHNFDVLHWFLGDLPVSAIAYGGIKVRHWRDTLDHVMAVFEWPGELHVDFEASQVTPPPYRRHGEHFTGTKSTIEVWRSHMSHYKPSGEIETIKAKRDITMDALENFIERVLTGDYENVAVRSAQSTMIAILGREAVYRRREVTWKGLYGVHG